MPGLTYLRMICEQVSYVEVVKAFNNPLVFIEEQKLLDYDLCILDIEMQGLNGLDVARLLENKLVIFTTAHKEYAAEAFDIDAVDYICKPIYKERLEKAISKAINIINSTENEKLFIQLNTDRGKTLLFFDRILLITTASDEKRDKLVFLDNDQILLLKNISLEQLLLSLPKVKFCRINKREIIAFKAVKFFTHDEIVTTILTKEGKAKVVTLSSTYKNNFIEQTVR